MSGKGDARRPRLVDQRTYEDNWQQVFGKKDRPQELPEGVESGDPKEFWDLSDDVCSEDDCRDCSNSKCKALYKETRQLED